MMLKIRRMVTLENNRHWLHTTLSRNLTESPHENRACHSWNGCNCVYIYSIMPGTNAAPMPFFRYSRDRLDFLSGVYDLFWDSVQ